jgi:hypothetical protein
MPRHDLECNGCKKVFEALRITNVQCPYCGSADTVWLPKANMYKFTPFWHPHLGHAPVEITSTKQLDRELEKVGGYIKTAPTKTNKRGRRLPESYEEARDAN